MNLTTIKRDMPHWLLRGAGAGLIVLGMGGRALMRVIAHMEHRPQLVLTLGGTLTVIFAGTVAGLVAGFIYFLSRVLFRQRVIRAMVFIVAIELIVWRGVSGLLLVPQLLFLGLGAIFIAVLLSLPRAAADPA
ncbi:MAG TPA: hypothetical protein VJ825_13325 [Gemmatimonadaceae bacterium]|nr:hypothetical protein [Gemmatimonadaceae bacterium]